MVKKYAEHFRESEKKGWWRCVHCKDDDPSGLVKIEENASTACRRAHLRTKHSKILQQIEVEWEKKASARTKTPLGQKRLNFQPLPLKRKASSSEGSQGDENEEEEGTSSQKKCEPKIQRALNQFTLDGETTRKIDRAISMFIAMDARPVQTVEGKGFRNLMKVLQPKYGLKSRHFYSRTVLPQLYLEAKAKIKQEIASAAVVSFTSDVWTDKACKHSLVSLTAHWVHPTELRPVHRAIGILPLNESHTSQALSDHLRSCLTEFRIEESRRLILLRDGARNMEAAGVRLSIASAHCFAHSLQLSIKKGLAGQKISNLAEKLKKLVRKVRKSNVERAKFLNALAEADLPERMLIKNVEIRWSSLYDMISRFLENREAVEIYLHEKHSPASSAKDKKFPKLDDEEWEEMIRIRKLLHPFQKATTFLQHREIAQLSTLIPLHQILRSELETVNDGELAEVRNIILNDMKKRIRSYLENDEETRGIIVVSTLVDARFKDCFFRGLIPDPKAVLEQAAINVIVPNSDSSEDTSTEGMSDEGEAEAVKDDPFELFVKRHAPRKLRKPLPERDEKIRRVKQEIEDYLAEGRADTFEDPFTHWRIEANQLRFPTIFHLAKRYLSAPATSVESERLFSVASRVLSDLRKSLSDESLQQLLFLNFNS